MEKGSCDKAVLQWTVVYGPVVTIPVTDLLAVSSGQESEGEQRDSRSLSL